MNNSLVENQSDSTFLTLFYQLLNSNNMATTKQDKIASGLDQWFLHNDEVTSLDLKLYLINTYPEEMWTQQYVSAYLQTTNFEFIDNGRFRTYLKPVTLTVQVLQEIVDDIMAVGDDVTKTKIKSYLRAQNYPLTDFKMLFNQLGLQHTGEYTADNHKIWLAVPVGKHLSKTKGSLVDISGMAKPYLKNAFLKLWTGTALDMDVILNQPNCEEYKLLQAFFTYDVRKSLSI